MAASSIPTIPPRPARSQHPQGATGASKDIPQIPPRPINRRNDRSVSPLRDNYAPSPLNETPPLSAGSNSNGFYGSRLNPSTSSLPRRPPSVSIPTIGQEGQEYANFPYDDSQEELVADKGDTTQIRNIGIDVHVHAPKASLPASAAKGRVAGVTRIDSSQAAAAGFGKPSDHKLDGDDRTPTPKASMSRTGSSSSAERPPSVQPSDDEHGIPQLGARVPLYPNYGDVQAPSPAPFAYPSGAASASRPGSHHTRTRSARESFTSTPDIYGLRHPAASPLQDQFEKAWYQKHPEAMVKDGIGAWEPALPPKAEWALSSDELNKLVRNSANRGLAIGKEPPVSGTPDEQTGYIGAEEYALRLAASRPQSAAGKLRTESGGSHGHVESPLRKSFAMDEESAPLKDAELHRVRSRAVESEAEDDEVIHVDPPSRRMSRILGAGFDTPHAELETQDELLEDHDYSAPILAPDEVAKTPGASFLQPAVTPPPPERRDSAPHADVGHHLRSSFISGSRPQMSIMHGLPKQGFYAANEGSGTPLEDVEEYEPLFPEEDDGAKKIEKPLTMADRLKRPELNKHRFPSQDIWEDAPDSLRLQATVSTPDLPLEQNKEAEASPVTAFETPEQEAARRKMSGDVSEDRASFLPNTTKRFINPHLDHLNDDIPTRPGMKQRFPSRDIWEDAPDSLQLETTVRTPEVDEAKSPPEARPTTGAMAFAQDKAASGEAIPISEGRATTGIAATLDRPSVPTRPAKKLSGDDAKPPQPIVPSRPAHRAQSPEKKAPVVPDRPKPQVPARPAKPTTRGSSEQVPLAKVASAGSTSPTGSIERGPADSANLPPAPKPKPNIPARPNGSKIAALKAGFMSDLESRLQAGPQAHKPAEKQSEEVVEEKEKAPLSDARKGRARGPARRKPAASPSGAAEEPAAKSANKLEVAGAWMVWQISEDGEVDVETIANSSTNEPHADTKAAQSRTPTLATNLQGASVHAPEEISKGAEISAHPPNKTEDAIRSQEEQAKLAELTPDADKHDDTMVELEKGKEYVPTPEQLPPAETVEPKAADLNPPPTDSTTEAVSESTQTGEHVIKSPEQTVVAYLDGAAQQGNVIIDADEEARKEVEN